MSTTQSVAEILVNLETQMAWHREREAHHAGQEAQHRELRERHAAELADLTRRYEAFKAAAGDAAEVAARTPPPQPAPPPEPSPAGGPSVRSQLVARLVAELPAGEVFNASRVAAEAGRRFKRPLDPKLASTALRRLHAKGRLRLVEKGTAHRQALYTRV